VRPDRELGKTEIADRKRNIVFFLPDDMYLEDYAPWQQEKFSPGTPGDMNCASTPIQNRGAMPNFERIAQTGGQFTRAYSTSSTCAPSRFSVMTGRYPSRSLYGRKWTQRYMERSDWTYVHADVSFFSGSDNQMNVASALRAVGYTTGMVGKWHLLSDEDGGSFDTPYEVQTELVRSTGFDFVDGLYITNFVPGGSFSHNMEWVTEAALRFMDDAMRRELPFFLYFNPTSPHKEPSADEALQGVYNSSQTPAGLLPSPPDVSRYCSSCRMAAREDVWAAPNVLAVGETSAEELAGPHLLQADLRWVDEALGVLYDFLSERGALGSTYIVITTDHGPAKNTLYELGTRVPLYAIGPGISAGHRVTDLVSHVDLAPTFLAWAGCSAQSCAPFPMDGVSWSALASAGVSSLERKEIFTEIMLDRSLVTADGMKYYERRMISQDYLFQVLLDGANSTVKEYVYGKVDFGHLHEDTVAYPNFGEYHQMYNLNADRFEQKNLGSMHGELLRARIEARDAAIYALGPPGAATPSA
jgi:arylsulfatase A-like enzyme